MVRTGCVDGAEVGWVVAVDGHIEDADEVARAPSGEVRGGVTEHRRIGIVDHQVQSGGTGGVLHGRCDGDRWRLVRFALGQHRQVVLEAHALLPHANVSSSSAPPYVSWNVACIAWPGARGTVIVSAAKGCVLSCTRSTSAFPSPSDVSRHGS